MPFINVKTNVSLSDSKKEAVKSGFGQAISALPGKSENWLMVGIEADYDLWFKGDKSPAALVEVQKYGTGAQGCDALAAKITDILSSEAGISPSRIYVSFFGTDDWSWNGSMF